MYYLGRLKKYGEHLSTFSIWEVEIIKRAERPGYSRVKGIKKIHDPSDWLLAGEEHMQKITDLKENRSDVIKGIFNET